jgi:hypothetical protein
MVAVAAIPFCAGAAAGAGEFAYAAAPAPGIAERSAVELYDDGGDDDDGGGIAV